MPFTPAPAAAISFNNSALTGNTSLGNTAISGIAQFSNIINFGGIISPTGLTGTLNDWNPTGWGSATIIRFTTASSTSITGLAGGQDGRAAILFNLGTSDAQIMCANTSSIAANRFAAAPTGQTQISLRSGQNAIFEYDAATSLWRYIAGGNIAYNTDIWKGINYGAFVTPGDFANSANFTNLLDAATVAWDIPTQGYNATITLGGNRTIGAPTGLWDGLPVCLELVQDATGSRIPTWNAIWEWGAAGAPTLQTATTKRDLVFGIYRASTGKIHASFRKGA